MKNGIKGEFVISFMEVPFKLVFERYYINDEIEQIRITIRDKIYELQSNRPYLKNHHSLKPVQWNIISGMDIKRAEKSDFYSELIFKLEMALDTIDFRKDKKYPLLNE